MDASQQVNAEHYRAEARRIRREAAIVKDEAIPRDREHLRATRGDIELLDIRLFTAGSGEAPSIGVSCEKQA
jgi:hypothetical protein